MEPKTPLEKDILCLQLRFKYYSRFNCTKFYRQATPGLYNLFENELGEKHVLVVMLISVYLSRPTPVRKFALVAGTCGQEREVRPCNTCRIILFE